jgi:2-methylfumaryl-CoA isomerase
VYIAPSIGENTDQILSEVLRLSAGEIGKLHDERIVANRIVR